MAERRARADETPRMLKGEREKGRGSGGLRTGRSSRPLSPPPLQFPPRWVLSPSNRQEIEAVEAAEVRAREGSFMLLRGRRALRVARSRRQSWRGTEDLYIARICP